MRNWFAKILFTVVVVFYFLSTRAQVDMLKSTSEVQISGASMFTQQIDGIVRNPCSTLQDSSKWGLYTGFYKPFSVKGLSNAALGLALSTKSKLGFGFEYRLFQAPMFRQSSSSLVFSAQLLHNLQLGVSSSYLVATYQGENQAKVSGFTNLLSAKYRYKKLQIACAYQQAKRSHLNYPSIGLSYTATPNFSVFTQLIIKKQQRTIHSGISINLSEKLRCFYALESGISQSIGIDYFLNGLWLKIGLANHNNLGLWPASGLIYEQDK